MNNSGAFRKKKVYFTQVSNIALRRNGGLSLKAKGLYGLIQSFITIPDFTLYKTTLRKECIEGDKAFESAWKELKDKGFLVQYRLQGDNGCFYYEYELLDEPMNTEPIEQQLVTKNNDNIHTPKKEGVDKGDSGKGGKYTNTIPTNTDLNNTYSNKKNKEKVHKGYKVIIEEYTNNLELQQAIYSFIEMRKANKTVMTDRSLTMLLNRLNKFADTDLDKIEILNNSILNSWKNVFPLETKKEAAKKIKEQESLDRTNKKQLGFKNFDERKYDYDTLEKQLLGWTD